ncbi:hypothetical protein, partial [Streptomyces prasinopilosus]|uniref:hypothetical protein n=1 Tax=Streptomyces prasinopilosus TaxID=67344 RepID=UPI0006EB820B
MSGGAVLSGGVVVSGVPVASGGVVGRVAEPSDAVRARRGPRSPAGLDEGAWDRWLTEPSEALRVRRPAGGASGVSVPGPATGPTVSSGDFAASSDVPDTAAAGRSRWEAEPSLALRVRRARSAS